MSSFKERLIGAAKLDIKIYEEVENDKDALTQAMFVVILSNLAAGLGGIVQAGIRGLLMGTIMSLIGWFFLGLYHLCCRHQDVWVGGSDLCNLKRLQTLR